MNKKILTLVVVLLVAGGAFFILKPGKKSEFNPENKDSKSIVEEAQKTFKEQQSGENKKIRYAKSIDKDEEVSIEFMMHDYTNAPKDPNTLQETKDSLIAISGKASFKVKDIGTIKDIDKYNTAGEGKTFHYIIYEFKGDSSNPDSNTIHPSSLSETGWDPAPQFVTVVDGEDDYPGSYWEDALLKLKGYDKVPFNTDFTTDEWVTKAAVWKVDENEDSGYALKYISTENKTTYFKVQQ